MTRGEHIQWCKDRALEELNAGNTRDAVISMLSDLGKHDETKNHAGGMLGAMLLMNGNLNSHNKVKEWIEGFN